MTVAHSSQNEIDEEVFSWRYWLLDGLRDVVYAGLGIAVIVGVLGLEYLAGINIKFDFGKNSPEIGYIIAGVLGGVTVVRLHSRRRLRIEQELSATLAEALPNEDSHTLSGD